MYEDIFGSIRNEAAKRNLRESTSTVYCNAVGYFFRTTNKEISELTTDGVKSFLTEKRLNGLSPQTYMHTGLLSVTIASKVCRRHMLHMLSRITKIKISGRSLSYPGKNLSEDF